MRSCDQADINFVRAVTAEPLEFLLLQDAQQLRLKFERNVADLIKKERALVRRLKASRFLRDRSRERSFFMTEQFTLQEPKRNCGAIQFHKSTFPSAAQIVDCTRDEFFAGPRFAQDQHTRVCGRYYGHKIQRRLQRGALADDFSKLGANFLLQIESLFRLF